MKRNVMSTKVQQSTFVAAKSTSRSAKWRDYFQMTKPTISLLVVATVVPSMFMAAEGGLPSLAKLVGHCSVRFWLQALLECSITWLIPI